MQFILYNTLDGENVINKTLTDRVSVDIILKRDVVIDSPRIVLLNDGLDYSAFNYAEIPDFNRFYFIRGYDQINARMVSLELETDVLETFKLDILASNAQYRTRITSGLYGNFQPETTGVKIESIHESNVELTPSNSAIFSVMRWQ